MSGCWRARIERARRCRLPKTRSTRRRATSNSSRCSSNCSSAGIDLGSSFARGLPRNGAVTVGRFLFDVELVVLPRLKAALQLHHRILLGRKLHASIGGQMALLTVAIDDVGFVFAQPLRVVPLSLGNIDGARDVAFGKI